MQNYMSIISIIDGIKDSFNNNKYCDWNSLEKDFYSISDLLWDDIDDLHETDLNELCGVHDFLINQVCYIHDMENDTYNKEIFDKNLNIKGINKQIRDGKRASNIYMFNDDSYDYYIIGDLHSDNNSLKQIIKECNFFNSVTNKSKIRLVFLGDYVDRGKVHLRLLESILCLKYIFPKNIYLLRGNHDGGFIKDGQVKLCVGKPEDENDEDYFLLYLKKLSEINSTFKFSMAYKYLEFFNSLSYIAFINQKNTSVLAVHGGIPRPRRNEPEFYNYINCISDLTDNSIVDNINRTITHNIMWSDPVESTEDLREGSGRFKFTVEDFEEFRRVIGFDLLVRGHQAEKEGYKRYFDGKLYTIFSSGRILNNNENINNETAYKDIAPSIFNIDKKGKYKVFAVK